MKKTKNGTVYCEEFSNSHDFIKDLTQVQRMNVLENVVRHYIEYWGGEKYERVKYSETLYEKQFELIVLTFKANTINTNIMIKINKAIQKMFKNIIVEIRFEINFNKNNIYMIMNLNNTLPF